MIQREIVENYEYRLTDDIELLILRKMSSQNDRENIYKESDERHQIDMVYDKKYYERDQMG